MSIPPATTIPSLLLEHDQWVCWREQTRGEKPTKVPVNPSTGRYALTNDPDTWASFDDARSYATGGSVDGIGFVFTEDDPLVGIDLDSARDPDTQSPTEWAATIIERLNSYTEISPSGTGYHVLVTGSLPPGRNRRGTVELYETARFFTVTGDHVDETPTTIHERTEGLTSVYRNHVADEADGESNTTVTTNAQVDTEITLEDEELLERAKGATNGEKFDRLWRGDTSGYESHSEADMALCCLLAFWTGGDTGRMDSLFRQSGLLREKWDDVHYADGSTYGEKTLKRASNVTTDYYTPGDQEAAQDDSATAQRTRQQTKPPSKPTHSAEQHKRMRDETTSLLETRLRELEGENDRLRDELKEERMKRETLERAGETISTTTSIWERLKQLVTR
ncbi:phage NrS-1 polymerase family protein [Haladaptatus sp. NG-SE-30]